MNMFTNNFLGIRGYPSLKRNFEAYASITFERYLAVLNFTIFLIFGLPNATPGGRAGGPGRRIQQHEPP